MKAAHSIERIHKIFDFGGRYKIIDFITEMIKTFCSALNINSSVYYTYPTPKQLNNATEDQLRECGLSFRKVEYIKDISKLTVEGKLDLEKFKEYDNTNQIIDELCKIREVGIWTAELTVLR